MDHMCINEKPNIDRKIEKGRRHAGYAKLKKHLSKDAYLSKDIVFNGKIRVRDKNKIISDTTLTDSISLNVSYSLNRKNRWNTISPITLNINALNSMPNDVSSVAVVEQMNTVPDIGCQNIKTKKHLTEGCVTGITMSDQNGYIKIKESNSSSGANLSSLLGYNKKNNETNELVEKNDYDDSYDSSKGKAQIRYRINTSHKNTDYSVCKHFKQRLKVAKASQKQGKKCKKINKKVEIDFNDLISDDEEEINIFKESPSTNKQITSQFVLSDFIKESSPSIIDLESIQSIGEMSNSNDDKIKPKNLLTFPDQIRILTIFDEIKISTSKWDNFNFVKDIDKLLGENIYNMKWIDDNKTRVLVDLSEAIQFIHPKNKKMKMMVVIKKSEDIKDTLKILFNTNFEISNVMKFEQVKRIIKNDICVANKNMASINDLIKSCITVGKCWYKLSEEKNKKDSKEINDWNEHDINFNTDLLSETIKPIDEYQLYEILANEVSNDLENSLSDDEKSVLDIQSDDNFEKINISDLKEMDIEKEFEHIMVKCDICEASLCFDNTIILNECRHSFCSDCITRHFYNQIRLEEIPLKCPQCQKFVSLDILPVIFPLPLISFYIYLRYTKKMEKEGFDIIYCLKCKDIATKSLDNPYNTVNCQNCNIYWCILCKKAPHYPLKCKQSVEWKERFNKRIDFDNIFDKNYCNNANCQTCRTHWCVLCKETPRHLLTSKQDVVESKEQNKDSECKPMYWGYWWPRYCKYCKVSICFECKRADNSCLCRKNIEGREESTELLGDKNNFNTIDRNNYISQQFFDKINEIHKIRFDNLQFVALFRQWSKKHNPNSDKTYIQLRKTLLYLCEYCYGWLYLNRKNKPENYTKIKNILSDSFIHLKTVDRIIANNLSENIDNRLKKIKKNIDIILNEFSN